MGNTVPVRRQVKRSDGTVYTAVRHMRASGPATGAKPLPAPAASSPAEAAERLVAAATRRGHSESNAMLVIDTAQRRAGTAPDQLTAIRVVSALNDCIDALGEDEYAEADAGTREAAERLIVASLHRIPANDRLTKMALDPDVDFDRLMELVTDEGVTDPVKVELLLEGGAKALLDGAL